MNTPKENYTSVVDNVLLTLFANLKEKEKVKKALCIAISSISEYEKKDLTTNEIFASLLEKYR